MSSFGGGTWNIRVPISQMVLCLYRRVSYWNSKDGSVVKITGCYSRGQHFNSLHPHGSPQQFVPPVPGNLVFLFWPPRAPGTCMSVVQTYMYRLYTALTTSGPSLHFHSSYHEYALTDLFHFLKMLQYTITKAKRVLFSDCAWHSQIWLWLELPPAGTCYLRTLESLPSPECAERFFSFWSGTLVWSFTQHDMKGPGVPPFHPECLS